MSIQESFSRWSRTSEKVTTFQEKIIPGKARFCVGSGIDSSWGKKVPDLELEEMEELAQIGHPIFSHHTDL